MPLPTAEFKSRMFEYTSVSTPVVYSPPIRWLEIVDPGSGAVTLKDEAGNVVALTALQVGEVLCGPFTELTSMTASKIRLGDGDPPVPTPGTTGTSAAASLTSRVSIEESADASGIARLSTADSVLTSTATSITTRLSTEESVRASADTSLTTRFSAADSVLTSAAASLTTRVSVAESVEASKG